MIKLIPILLFVGLTCGGDADGQDKLETAILGLIQGFNGDVGVYVRHLSSNTAVGVNENKIFPTASMVKVPILVKIFDKIEAGALTMDSVVIFNKALINYTWNVEDSLARLKDLEYKRCLNDKNNHSYIISVNRFMFRNKRKILTS